jgi:trans-2,3-dihydro-3-hydroxyanthranilate isomerase
MRGRQFYIVDVFAERKYAGNQLAVITEAQGLDGEAMQAIAREMNFSETTFILGPAVGEAAFRVRIFTPAEEVPFAGHPTLGTAWVIRRELLAEACDRVTLELGVGSIPVSFERPEGSPELLWMLQQQPEFGPVASTSELAVTLGIEKRAFVDAHPIQQVSTGLPFWIVPLNSLDDVRSCRLDAAAYEAFIHDRQARAILVFAAEAYDGENQINARMFAPYYGVPEDPATGSANGCLAAYLVRYGVLGGNEVDIRVEQGYEMGRPSLLRLRAWERSGRFEIHVGGRVIPVACGRLI